MNRNDIIAALAATLYTSYSAAVGGKAFNGDPLPSAEEFFGDDSKRKQTEAWVETARVAVEEFFPSSAARGPGITAQAQLDHATMVDKSLRRSLQLLVDTLDIQKSAGQDSRPRSLAKTKAQESAMWLGMSLGEIRETGLALGLDVNTNPYPGSKDPSTKGINPPAPEAPQG